MRKLAETRPAACTMLSLLTASFFPLWAEPIDVGDGKQLFMDGRFVEHAKDVHITSNEPLYTCEIDLPQFEGLDKSGSITVLELDGTYRMYYAAHVLEEDDDRSQTRGDTRVTCVAESSDGEHWTHVDAGLFELNGSHSNPIVIPGAMGTVFLDPNQTRGCPYWFIGKLSERTQPPTWEGADGAVYHTLFDEHGQYYHEGGVYLLCSKDGLAWERVEEPALPFWCDTQNQAFWDPNHGVYVAYLRGNNPPFLEKRRHVRRATTEQLDDTPWPFKRNPERKLGPNDLYGDLVNELPEVMSADDSDPPKTDMYNPCINVYPWADSAYFAFPSMYRHYDDENSYGRDHRGKYGNDGVLEVQVAVSRDGINFHRYRTPYVSAGLPGEPGRGGDVYMGVGMIRRGDYIYQYYSERPRTHGQPREPGEVQFRMAVQRLDGYVSIDAGPDGGAFTTPPIVFDGDRLELNVDCAAMGEVWIEILNASGDPIPGFTLNESVSADRNGIALEVWWQNGPEVGRLSGKPVRLRFKMRAAKLYAFQFVDSAENAPGPE